MGMAGNYIKAHNAMAHVVEESFRKMAKHCEFGKRKLPTGGHGNLCNTEMIMEYNRSRCHYPGGDNSGVCAREICPVLEKE
jgi:hypothetical protein